MARAQLQTTRVASACFSLFLPFSLELPESLDFEGVALGFPRARELPSSSNVRSRQPIFPVHSSATILYHSRIALRMSCSAFLYARRPGFVSRFRWGPSSLPKPGKLGTDAKTKATSSASYGLARTHCSRPWRCSRVAGRRPIAAKPSPPKCVSEKENASPSARQHLLKLFMMLMVPSTTSRAWG
eukprot:scaffold285_cov304-Pinguiococcus_pyrenoidosus.AAC.15